jgi:anti-anti-sigma factor
MRLKVGTSVAGSSTTVVVTGVIDWSTVGQFRAALAPWVSGPEPDVLVDLSGLLSWSCPGQAVLVSAATQARLRGGRLAAFGLSPVAHEQVHGSGLAKALQLYATQAEAQAPEPEPFAVPGAHRVPIGLGSVK